MAAGGGIIAIKEKITHALFGKSLIFKFLSFELSNKQHI